MTNVEAVNRFSQAHGAKIENLFWIAGAMENDDFKQLIDDLGESHWASLFPDIYNSGSFQEYVTDEDVLQMLLDFNKYGLIAEILLPTCDNFKYDGDKPVSWSVKHWNCRVAYVYAETMEELLTEIEIVAETTFQEYMTKDRAAKNVPTP